MRTIGWAFLALLPAFAFATLTAATGGRTPGHDELQAAWGAIKQWAADVFAATLAGPLDDAWHTMASAFKVAPRV